MSSVAPASPASSPCAVCGGVGSVSLLLTSLHPDEQKFTAVQFDCQRCEEKKREEKQRVDAKERGTINRHSPPLPFPLLQPGELSLMPTDDHWPVLLAECRENKQLLIVDVTGTWCGPSIACAPSLAALAARYDGVAFVRASIDSKFNK